MSGSSVLRRIARVGFVALGTGVLLFFGTGCSEDEASTASTGSVIDEPTDQPMPLGNVASVTELQDAFIAVGGDCLGDLESINKVTVALGSGVCGGSGTVLTIYIDHEAATDSTRMTMELLDRVGSTMILGENWVINPSGDDRERAADMADELGGQLLQVDATPIRSLEDAFTLEQAAQAYDEADGTECSNPRHVGEDQSVLECSDLTLIVESDLNLSTEAERQLAADNLSLDDGGVPIVGPRHVVVVYSEGVDVEAVAREIEGATPSS